jgi:6-phosphogluconolactonase (cycloisomerase 2 family)
MSKRKLSVLAYAAALVLSTNSSVVHAITKVSKYAYVAENSQIAVYAVNPDGGLRNIQAVSVPPGVTNSNGVLGVNVVVSPSNKFLYYLNAGQSISGFKIGTNGTLSQIAGSPFPANGATWIAFTPNGKFAYAVAFTYSQYVQEFEVDTSTGALTSIGSVFSGPDACDATVNSKGSFLYVPNCSGNTISAFSINGTSGVLTAVSGSPFTVPGVPVNALLSPKGKYLFSVNFANGHGGESISVFDVNSKTGALTLKSNNLSPSGWLYGGGEAILDPSGSFIYVASAVADVGVEAFSVNEVNGAIAPIGLYPAGSSAFSVTSDVDTGFLYVGNLGGGTATEPPLFAFSITPGTGALTQIATYGIDGQAGYILAFADGTASVAYTPTFAYATNSGSKSITEVSIAEGAFGAVTGSPLTDKNGPKTSVATENHEYFYTGNSNGSISEYKIEATGALAKIKGSPITGLVNSVALGFSPFYNLLYAEDPSADVEDIV